MGTLILLALCVVIATAAFIWLASGILAAISWPIARIGNAVHKLTRALPRNESDAWLFVLLLGISRVLVIVAGTLAFATALSVALLPVPSLVDEVRNALVNVFLILLIMRLVAIFLGAVIIGGSVRTVLRTLKN